MNLIRVSIVEDNECVRKSLAALIERSGFCELVSAYARAEDALDELILNSPDVQMMDIHIPRISGVECVNRLPHSPQTQHSDSESLSKREEEVLSLVAQGYINKEIADMTGLSVETVRSYLKNIYKKLHVRSRTAAAMKCFS